MKTLIVDDSATNAELLELFLTPYGACRIVSNGKEALECFSAALDERAPYNLVCLDIMMPEMDGQTVLKELRRIEEEKGIFGLDGAKVVMTTAADVREHMMRAFKSQCDGFISKPVTKNELLKHVYNLGLVDADTLVRGLLKITDADV